MASIALLDGYTLNPGDLSWGPLEALGDLRTYDRTPPESIFERACGAELLLTNKTPLTAETLRQLPDLRYIGVLATGFNVVDVAEARERGILVTNIPAYSTESVAQHVFAFILDYANQVARHDSAVQEGGWVSCADFSFALSPLIELKGQTLAIFGLGAIGQAVAQIGRAFGMRVIGHSRSRRDVDGVTWVDRDQLFAEADFLSLHCPLTESTRELINVATLQAMKPTAMLINTGRGPLVNEVALAEALRAGTIAAAAVDVLSTEPPTPDNPLIGAPNCRITPHNAWASKSARERLLSIAADNIEAFLRGTPQNVVN